MTSILYPEGDFTSADIAIKLQALAQAQAGKIFIVPKHLGRNEQNISKNLKQSKTAILLIHDKFSLDANTDKELKYLLTNKAIVYSIAPTLAKGTLKLPAKVSTHFYDQNKSDDFLKTVQKIISDLRKRETAGSDFSALLVVMALIILIVAAFDNDKK